jgi:dTDP-4-dehydrorhamnose 3,5-epimerase
MASFTPLEIPAVILIEPRVFSDERGFFMETYQQKQYSAFDIPTTFVQDNQSGSKKGVLRGIHYQLEVPQGKLVRVVAGEILDIAVDLRRSSPTFGKWVSAVLSADNKKQIWIPAGFGHGFYTLSTWAEIFYKATDFYTPTAERCIIWNDPTLNIDWNIQAVTHPILSPKDALGKKLAEADIFE